ncbi:MAG: DUF3825 domain-containing protein [Atopobiaceae bacterium]
MARSATVGNRLYIYALLRDRMGVGKQEFLPKVEALLQDDNIYPEDMGYQDVRQMLADFGDFVTLTEFKGGRTYVRLVARPDWDTILEADAAEGTSKAKSSGSSKPWKHGKKVTKSVRPVRPRHKAPKKAAAPQADAKASGKAAAVEAPAGTTNQAEAASPQQAVEVQKPATVEQSVSATQEPVAPAVSQAPEPTTSQQEASPNGLQSQGQKDTDSAQAQAAKKGTAAPDSVGTEAPEAAQSSQTDAPAEPPAEPTLPKHHPITLTVVTEDGQERTLEATAPTAQKSPEPEAPRAQAVTQTHEAVSAVGQPASDESAQRAAATVVPSPLSATQPQQTTPAAGSTPAAPAPAQAPQRHVTAQPDAPAGPAPAQPAPQEQPAQQPWTQQAPAQTPVAQDDQAASMPFLNANASVPSSLPTSFLKEVHCKDELLSVLTRMLPFDVDMATMLEEDWQVALSTGTATGTRSKVVFPIRYLRPDGTAHIELTLRRSSKTIAGKHWTLSLVDGDDGSGTLHEAAGLEGAPQGDEGAWQDLSASLVAPDRRVSPLRELAQFCSIGSWDGFLGALTSMAAPERWNYPDEGVGQRSRLGVLREYLCVTFHRLQQEHKVCVSPDGSFCAMNTGLMTPMVEDIHACFVPNRKGGAPWSFAGFAVAGTGELGRKITATFDPLPQPASYIESLDQVMPRASKLIALDYRAIIGRQLDRLPQGFLKEQLEHHEGAAPLLQQALEDTTPTQRADTLRQLGRVIIGDPGLYRRMCLALDDAVAMAMRRVRASFRLCAPAYDPQTNQVDLLLPLALIQDGQADCALVLEPQPSGNYQAASVLTLPRAYACARVVSKYQPAWLLPSVVLKA